MDGEEVIMIVGLILLFFGCIIFIYLLFSYIYSGEYIFPNNGQNFNCTSGTYGNRCQYLGPNLNWSNFYISEMTTPLYEEKTFKNKSEIVQFFRNNINENPFYNSFFMEGGRTVKFSNIPFQINKLGNNRNNHIMIRNNQLGKFINQPIISNSWTTIYNDRNSQFLHSNQVISLNMLPRILWIPQYMKINKMIISKSKFNINHFDDLFKLGNTSKTRTYSNLSSINTQNPFQFNDIPFHWIQDTIYIAYI